MLGSINQPGLDAVLLHMVGRACVKSVAFHLGDSPAVAVSGSETLSYDCVSSVAQL